MGGCPNLSGQMHFVPHSPRIIDAWYAGGVIPLIAADHRFDVPMDDSSIPDLTHWDGVLDGIPTPVSSMLWISNTVLRIVWNFWPPPATSAYTRLLSVDHDCKDAQGNIAFAPQTIQWL